MWFSNINPERNPLNQNYRKVRYRIEHTGIITSETLVSMLSSVVFSAGNLEIPDVFCSIGHFISV